MEEQRETLLPRHEDDSLSVRSLDHEKDVDEEEASDCGSEDYTEKKTIKGALWVILSTMATLSARRLLRDGGFPIYFTLLVQVTAYCIAAVLAVGVKLFNFRKGRRKTLDEKYSILETIVIGFRLLVSGCISAVAMLCAAEALMRYNNLFVMAMMPILTYVTDSFLFMLFHLARITRRKGVHIHWRSLWRIILVLGLLAGSVVLDYKLNLRALFFALTASGLFSLSKVVFKIGPRIEKGPSTWTAPLYTYLVVGIPFLIITGNAASKYENLVAASHVVKSWTTWRWFTNIIPAVLVNIIFTSSVNSAYPYLAEEVAGGAMDDPSIQAGQAVRSTLHTAFWVTSFGVFGREYALVDWLQVIFFTVIYVASVGPRHIGYFPPRLLNLLCRISRRKPQPIREEPWQFKTVLLATTLLFSILMSTNLMHWITTSSYNRNAKTWLDPPTITVDTQYRSPQLRSFDVIIAHSMGDPQESIRELMGIYTSNGGIRGFGPKVMVYTKDDNFDMNSDNLNSLRSEGFNGQVTVQKLKNSGGVTATFLHHILVSWDSMAQQSLFVSTSSKHSLPLDLQKRRLDDYFKPAGFPVPDAEPKTGFLHLGKMEHCWCGECKDSTGWEDSFHLVPSMWGAARPGTSKCESVLLTQGNDFIASAARIRGVKKDVWQMLFDGLTNEDMGRAWAHDSKKFPVQLPGEKNIERWGEKGIYGTPDSLQNPWMGHTVERLWGILLQCSTPQISWQCPNLWRGSRLGWDKDDCSCID
ncbi:hypothetical protein BGZ60DRAFT_532111 [Tricladium varicosporioides]|nr:hypothetical protein BGZ60DRAFT_532111 [Hymenoscyphus varicosporioides]